MSLLVEMSSSDLRGITWLAREAEVDPRTMAMLLVRLRNSRSLYSRVAIPKPGGGERILDVPNSSLCQVQRKLNKNVLSELSVPKGVYGFSGGDIISAITPHLESNILLSFDIIDAFGWPNRNSVLISLTEGRRWFNNRLTSYGSFSRYVAVVLADLCTHNSSLPQGAPTSPRIFDQFFKKYDKKIFKIAQNVGGVYTRYADNLFVSLPERTYFSPKLERAILRATIDKYSYPRWHKVSVRRLNGDRAVRMLGLNVLDGQISVPRAYKRRLRLGIHHVRYLWENGLPYETEWMRLRGQMSFGELGVLPDSLMSSYQALEKEIEGF